MPYLVAHGVRLARVVYEPTAKGEPRLGGAALHVLFELGDHLGSTSVVLDKATSELVEASTYQGYGAKESDYRPARWQGFREDYGFTGKEDDVEFGIVYFGKRFYSPGLNRWLSPDPLAVHVAGNADLNLYAYVRAQVLKATDPLGLDCDSSQNQCDDGASGPGNSSTAPTPPAANPPAAPAATADSSPETGGNGPAALTDGQVTKITWAFAEKASRSGQRLEVVVSAPEGRQAVTNSVTGGVDGAGGALPEVPHLELHFGTVNPGFYDSKGDLSGGKPSWVSTEVLWGGVAPPGTAALEAGAEALVERSAAKTAELIPWSSGNLSRASRLLDQGETSVTLASRAEAEELFLGKFQASGYRNTTRLGSQLYDKSMTYHWDETFGADGFLEGHAPTNPHATIPHLQIHTSTDIIRIFFR